MGSKVSLIVPVYNVERYVRKCLESIKSQTYTNFEVLIIDDGSTDRSGAICDEFGQKDDRFIIIHTVNRGLSAARNLGLDRSHGEYICFVDSDDYLEPNYLEHLYNMILQTDCDFVSCCANYVDENGRFIKRNEYAQEECLIEAELLKVYFNSNFIEDAAWNKIYKRELFRDLRYTEGIIYEDTEFIIRLLRKCKKVYFKRAFYYNYRIRRDSILSYQSDDIHSKSFTYKKLDLLRVYDSNIEDLEGTPWTRSYYRRILFLCGDYWVASTHLPKGQRLEAKQKIRSYYNKYRSFLREPGLFTTKEKLVIYAQMYVPMIYNAYRAKKLAWIARCTKNSAT